MSNILGITVIIILYCTTYMYVCIYYYIHALRYIQHMLCISYSFQVVQTEMP